MAVEHDVVFQTTIETAVVVGLKLTKRDTTGSTLIFESQMFRL